MAAAAAVGPRLDYEILHTKVLHMSASSACLCVCVVSVYVWVCGVRCAVNSLTLLGISTPARYLCHFVLSCRLTTNATLVQKSAAHNDAPLNGIHHFVIHMLDCVP